MLTAVFFSLSGSRAVSDETFCKEHLYSYYKNGENKPTGGFSCSGTCYTHHVFIDMPHIPVERCIFHKGLDSMFILPLFNKTALKAVVSLHILLCDHKMFASKSQTEHVVRMDLLYSFFYFLKKEETEGPAFDQYKTLGIYATKKTGQRRLLKILRRTFLCETDWTSSP